MAQNEQTHIIELLGITQGQRIPSISYNLPGNVDQVKSILITANEDGPASANYGLGMLSLWFDNKGKHVISTQVSSAPMSLINRRIAPLQINEPVKPNSMIQGYYIDNGLAPVYPYNIKIYLNCKPRAF